MQRPVQESHFRPLKGPGERQLFSLVFGFLCFFFIIFYFFIFQEMKNHGGRPGLRQAPVQVRIVFSLGEGTGGGGGG